MQILLSASSVDITPVHPIPLSGFAERKGVYSQVKDKLEINLAAIKLNGKTILLYSIDTLFVPEAFEQLITEKYNIDSKDVWMVASHTHYAPSLDKEKPALGKMDDSYYQDVKVKLLALTDKVLSAEFREVTITYGSGTSELNVNRRKKLLRPKGKFGLYWKVLMYPDYDGAKDDDIHVLKFLYEDGATALVLWNYACHPVGYPHLSRVTSEYVGAIRNNLREKYEQDRLPVVFLIGFAGNLKPDLTPVTHTRWKDRLNYFFQLGPKFVRFPSTSYYTAWTEKLWGEMENVLGDMHSLNVASGNTSQCNLPLSAVIGDSAHHIQFKKLTFGNDLSILGVSAEVLAEYKHEVSALVKGKTINVGCLAGTRIYLPTDKHINEGGYEVHGFGKKFGIEGEFKSNIVTKVLDAISKL